MPYNDVAYKIGKLFRARCFLNYLRPAMQFRAYAAVELMV